MSFEGDEKIEQQRKTQTHPPPSHTHTRLVYGPLADIIYNLCECVRVVLCSEQKAKQNQDLQKKDQQLHARIPQEPTHIEHKISYYAFKRLALPRQRRKVNQPFMYSSTTTNHPPHCC